MEVEEYYLGLFFNVCREFRDATRVFGRLQPAEDWERFLNNHSS